MLQISYIYQMIPEYITNELIKRKPWKYHKRYKNN